MKSISKIAITASISIIVYLVIDIIHFFIFRINPLYPSFTEAFYESHFISYIKWVLSVIILISLRFDSKGWRHSFYSMFISSIGIILLFILKGQLMFLIRGSIVFKVGLLEITALLVLTQSIIISVKKYKIGWYTIVSVFLATCIILVYLFYQLPVYCTPY